MAHITMREAISQALWEEMERDPAVFILGEEVGVWGGSYAVTKGFYDHFGGERVPEGEADPCLAATDRPGDFRDPGGMRFGKGAPGQDPGERQ